MHEVGLIENRYRVADAEEGLSILLASGMRGTWAAVLPALRHHD